MSAPSVSKKGIRDATIMITPDLPDKVHLHMLRRTRATNLYQSNVELELVSRILGHASTQTTRIYARPSLEMIREAMDRSNPELNAEKPLWLEDEEEFAKLCGLRIIIM